MNRLHTALHSITLVARASSTMPTAAACPRPSRALASVVCAAAPPPPVAALSTEVCPSELIVASRLELCVFVCREARRCTADASVSRGAVARQPAHWLLPLLALLCGMYAHTAKLNAIHSRERKRAFRMLPALESTPNGEP